MQSLLARLMPFILFGILFVLAVVGFILFSYLLIFGSLVGLVLFVVAWIRRLFSRNKQETSPASYKKQGRIIDHS